MSYMTLTKQKAKAPVLTPSPYKFGSEKMRGSVMGSFFLVET